MLPAKEHIHPDEWLQDAKSCHVGGSKRVYHGRESNPNMVVWNNEDSWSCWCHKCHKGGKVRKELVQIRHKQPEKLPSRGVPRDLLPISYVTTNKIVTEWMPRMIRHWQEKGVSFQVLERYNPMFSVADQRIVFHTEQGVIGRDLSGQSKAKWYNYTDGMRFAVAHKGEYSGMVLTEDFYSAAKISFYTPYMGIACLGTRVAPALTVLLLDAGVPIGYMLDGDKAGHDGEHYYGRMFGVLGLDARKITTPEGLDPKDLPPDVLNDTIKGILDAEPQS